MKFTVSRLLLFILSLGWIGFIGASYYSPIRHTSYLTYYQAAKDLLLLPIIFLCMVFLIMHMLKKMGKQKLLRF